MYSIAASGFRWQARLSYTADLRDPRRAVNTYNSYAQSPMAVDPNLVLWLAAACLAVIGLAQLMRNRQASLLLKLRNYVDEQHEWSKKKAKASRLARRLAREKAENEAKESRRLNDPNYDRYDTVSASDTSVDPPQEQPVQEAV